MFLIKKVLAYVRDRQVQKARKLETQQMFEMLKTL